MVFQRVDYFTFLESNFGFDWTVILEIRLSKWIIQIWKIIFNQWKIHRITFVKFLYVIRQITSFEDRTLCTSVFPVELNWIISCDNIEQNCWCMRKCGKAIYSSLVHFMEFFQCQSSDQELWLTSAIKCFPNSTNWMNVKPPDILQ